MTREEKVGLCSETPGGKSRSDSSHIVSTYICYDDTGGPTDDRTNHALLQQIEICKHGGPSKHDLDLLRTWLISAEGNASSLRGPGWDIWEKPQEQLRNSETDYLVLSTKHRNKDRFERWVGDNLLGVYHRLIGRRFKVIYLPAWIIWLADGIE